MDAFRSESSFFFIKFIVFIAPRRISLSERSAEPKFPKPNLNKQTFRRKFIEIVVNVSFVLCHLSLNRISDSATHNYFYLFELCVECRVSKPIWMKCIETMHRSILWFKYRINNHGFRFSIIFPIFVTGLPLLHYAAEYDKLSQTKVVTNNFDSKFFFDRYIYFMFQL